MSKANRSKNQSIKAENENRDNEISRRLFRTLDGLGYSSDMIKMRKIAYQDFDLLLMFFYGQSVYIKTVGSRGEGLTKVFESDNDFLFFRTRIICVDPKLPTAFIPNNVTIFSMVPCLFHPGHFKLMLMKESNVLNDREEVRSCLNYTSNESWLSTKKFLNKFNAGSETRTGPALTTTGVAGVSQDKVPAIFCSYPDATLQWMQRPRKHNWPPLEAIHKISDMPCNVVATGIERCPDQELEWRICFNEVELVLVECLNDTQIKLYKLLKMIKKDIFQSPLNQISSYIIKNLVFWLSESYPQSDFRSSNLFHWALKGLRLLRRAIELYNVPYYMIPERNLLKEKLPNNQRKEAERQITEILRCNFRLLYQCKKLKWAMRMTPLELSVLKDKSKELEVIYYQHMKKFLLFNKCPENELQDMAIYNLREKLLCSPWPNIVRNQMDSCTSTLEQEKLLLG